MAGKKINILLIEDDTFLSNIYKTKFEMEGFHVLTAENGEVGMKEAKKKTPDIILLDILLPKIDGFTLLEQFKSDAVLKSVPVILLTNLGQKDDVEKGLALGAEDYLIKAHFKPSETVEKVRKVLERVSNK
ncbi:MAG: response regulator [Candidatus Magasanikbacteria bacterium CG10_big_fil_rev_8_21_14_0_10_47_10]|uniref:Response regulator n=1 Tax=Candidatus Magasanikbacteria bacterium CG10_big_fil_rev_8_21_14_0_10_47_10 TaxID=1974652 RepID=A0A2H0TRS5_9BACT|nr:MAG: response regulator [Candidatus Magasanikbacteria bacterium CG10_big_fil_rev_8_21_14_0_10_47_10]